MHLELEEHKFNCLNEWKDIMIPRFQIRIKGYWVKGFESWNTDCHGHFGIPGESSPQEHEQLIPLQPI